MLLPAFLHYSQILMKGLGNIFPSVWRAGQVGNIDKLAEMHLGLSGYCPNLENFGDHLYSAAYMTKGGLKKEFYRKCVYCIVLCVVGAMPTQRYGYRHSTIVSDRAARLF